MQIRALPHRAHGDYLQRMINTMLYDAVIVGGGPAGLSAALALGRARKRVLVCDAGPRRNAPAAHMHNFVTRDGTPPDEFRALARQQLESYPNVQLRESRVDNIEGSRGAFQVHLESEIVKAQRVILCTGMIDEMLPLEGFRELWGQSIVQCPYCHGWEVRDQVWGCLALNPAMVPFAIHLRGWTRDVIVFTNGAYEVSPADHEQLQTCGVRLETRPIARLLAKNQHLEGLAFADGSTLACSVLFAHPPQRQVDLIHKLGLALDEHGFVRVDPMLRETSIPGIYAAGDLLTRMQAAIAAAAAGTHAAATLNHDLTADLAKRGLLETNQTSPT